MSEIVKTVVDAVPRYRVLIPPRSREIKDWDEFADQVASSGGPFFRCRITYKASNEYYRSSGAVDSFKLSSIDEEFSLNDPAVVFLAGRLPNGEIETLTYEEYRNSFDEYP